MYIFSASSILRIKLRHSFPIQNSPTHPLHPHSPEKQPTNLNSFLFAREVRSKLRSSRLVFPGHGEGVESAFPDQLFCIFAPHCHPPLSSLGLRPLGANKGRQHWEDFPGWCPSFSPHRSPGPSPPYTYPCGHLPVWHPLSSMGQWSLSSVCIATSSLTLCCL